MLRFLKSQVPGATLQEIAKSEGVSQAAVKKSITTMELYRKRNSGIEMDLAIRDLVISSVPQAKQTLDGLLRATELVEVGNKKTGRVRVVEMEDKTTRLEATRIVSGLIIGLQPKSPPVALNVNQTNQMANITQAETYEERLRRLRKQAQEHNLLPPEVAATPDYIDREEDAPDDDAEDEEELNEADQS